MQLLSVCIRPMMMATCTNRSVMQPLRWHCGGKGERSGTGPGGDQGVGAVQEEGSKASGQTDLLQLPQPCQAHGLPGVTVDRSSKAVLQPTLGPSQLKRSQLVHFLAPSPGLPGVVAWVLAIC